MFVCGECGQRYERGGYCATDGQALAQTDDPLLGTEIDRYRLARLLGEGGMGRVYLAVQPAIGSRVAIKLLSEQCTRSPELLDRFFAEAKAVNLIRHEHIVSVLDLALLPDGRPYIVMEFIEGQMLSQIVRTTVAPLGGVVQAMTEVLSGLAAAHHIGIVHRDLKPDNVLITVEGHAKVLDFGIAKLAPGLRDESSRTRTGALLGTPAYMAPEQISGAGHVDARADLYAAGVVLYEAVTGRVPFTGATLFDVMRAHVDTPPPSAREHRPDLPEALEQVIMTALAKAPAERFQSAQAMAQALSHAATQLAPDQWRPLSSRGGTMTPRVSASGQGLQPTPQKTPAERERFRSHAAPGRTETRRKRMGLVVGALAVAAVAAGIVLFVIAKTGGDDGSSGSAATPIASAGLVGDAAPSPSPPSRPPSPANGTAPVAVERPATPVPPPVLPPPGPVAIGRGASNGTPAHAVAAPADAGAGSGGPIVVGGGSAADHGVHIGSNVTIGPGVVIGAGTPIPPAGASATTLTRAADYDPKHFDPLAYLPKALAFAQQLLPDARLTEFTFGPAVADGHVDLTIRGDREYRFRSAAKSVRPTGLPRNMPVERPCMIYVELGPKEIVATLHTTEHCDARLVRTPRCTFASVWNQALADGVSRDVAARIGWLFDEKWFFDTGLDGTAGVSTYEDRCP